MREVLFIEDDPGQRELTERQYQMFAKRFHGEVLFTPTQTWKEGLEIIRARPIDVLILDLALPYDSPPLFPENTLELIRVTPNLPPVIVLTGAEPGADKWLPDKCLLAGADDFYLKKEINRQPELLPRACYFAYLRRQRDLRRGAPISNGPPSRHSVA